MHSLSPVQGSFAIWRGFKTPGDIREFQNDTNIYIASLGRDVIRSWNENGKFDGPFEKFRQDFGTFVSQWKQFYDSHDSYFSNFSGGAYDQTFEYRKQLDAWRTKFEAIGGKPTAPKPPDPDMGAKFPTGLVLGGLALVAGIVIIPKVIEAFKK